MIYLYVPERWIFFIGEVIVKIVPEEKTITIVDEMITAHDLYSHVKELYYHEPDIRLYEFPFYHLTECDLNMGIQTKPIIFLEEGWKVINKHLVQGVIVQNVNEKITSGETE
jgi:hypothetical protein